MINDAIPATVSASCFWFNSKSFVNLPTARVIVGIFPPVINSAGDNLPFVYLEIVPVISRDIS